MAKVPEGHTPLNLQNIGSLSLHKGELYWNGERVRTESQISWWLKLFIAVNAVALFVNALMSINRELCIYSAVPSCISVTSSSTGSGPTKTKDVQEKPPKQ